MSADLSPHHAAPHAHTAIANLIAEAEALHNAATPGPWATDDRNPGFVYCDDSVGSAVARPPDPRYLLRESAAVVKNAAFIARARTLIPELCEQIKLLHQDAARWRVVRKAAIWDVSAVRRGVRLFGPWVAATIDQEGEADITTPDEYADALLREQSTTAIHAAPPEVG